MRPVFDGVTDHGADVSAADDVAIGIPDHDVVDLKVMLYRVDFAQFLGGQFGKRINRIA